MVFVRAEQILPDGCTFPERDLKAEVNADKRRNISTVV